MTGRRRAAWAGGLLLAGLVAGFPLVVPDALVNLGLLAGIFALPALGLSLLMGRAGQVSLGQAGFFATGAYTSAVLVVGHGWNMLLAAVAAVALTMTLALAVGLPLLRLRGHYLALATLGFGIVVAVVGNEWSVTGATSGIYGIPRPRFNGRTYDSAAEFYWLVWPVVLVATLLARNLVASRVGRALAALGDSEPAARSLGVDTFRLRLQVFVTSAALASLGGSIYGHWITVVNASAASFLLSVEFLLMAVVGGLARVWGAVVGAVFVQALGEVLNRGVPLLVEGAAGEYQLIGFGLVLTAVVVLLPGGIVPAVRRGRTAGPAPAGPGAPDLQAAAGAAMPARPGRPGPGTPVLEVAGARRGFGGVVAVDGVDLVVRGGELVALIGPNGAGKSTLLDIVSGVAPAGGGTVRVRGRPVRGGRPDRAVAAGVARTFQHLEVFASLSALGNVKVGRHLRSGAGMVAGALRVPARAEEREIEASARRLLGLLGLTAVADVPAAELPFGQQRLVEVARALATEPGLLLLDEPMAGLSAAERAGLVRLLRGLADGGMALLVVEHDVDAVMAMADRVAVLDEGRLIALGPPAQVRADPAVLEAYLGGELEVARP